MADGILLWSPIIDYFWVLQGLLSFIKLPKVAALEDNDSPDLPTDSDAEDGSVDPDDPDVPPPAVSTSGSQNDPAAP
jgi:hypothetical protein